MAINRTAAGTYAVDFRDQNRKRIQRTFRTHKEARDFEKEVLAQVSTREYVAPTRTTIGEVSRQWYQRKKDAGTYRRSTLNAWRNHVENFIVPTLGQRKAHQTDIEAIEKAASEWSQRVSPAMVNKVLTTLTTVLALAKRYRMIKDNAAKEAERLKVATEAENSEVNPDQVYSKGEIRKLINATDPGSVGRLMVMVPALTGLRIGEVLGLTWPAVDLKASKLHVRYNLADTDKGEAAILQSPKTRTSRRIISVPPELARELKVWKLKCPATEHGFVFARVDGTPFHRKAASTVLDVAIAAAGVKRLTPHGLRHTFASLLLADGVPVTEVSHLLGHKDSYTTMKVYAHFVREETGSVETLASSILNGQ